MDELNMRKVGCFVADYSTKSNSCERRPYCFVLWHSGSVTPHCFYHYREYSRDRNCEIVAYIKWTSKAKRMKRRYGIT